MMSNRVGLAPGMRVLCRDAEWLVTRALQQLRPRLLLADAVGLGKTIQVGYWYHESSGMDLENNKLQLSRVTDPKRLSIRRYRE